MKRLLIGVLLILSVFIEGQTVQARGVDPVADSIYVEDMRRYLSEIRKHRPTVALVLSGGGAKGAAHVGVIRYIESLGIPVDVVLGTSMGGLIGGLYSLGYSIDQMDSLVRNMDWGWALSDELSREYYSYTDARYKEKYFLSVPFFYDMDHFNMLMADEYRYDPIHKHDVLHIGADSDDGLELIKKNVLGSLPSGYIYGQNVSNLISSLTIGYQDSTDFINLPIPFACVAADMISGKAKIWHSGKINDAMRSTMSIPGMFAPVRVEGMVLVDGGLRDNYPTALAREIGADIIIGVDLSQQRKTYMEVNNLGDIVGQGIDMLGLETFERNVNIPDVKIKPDLKEFNMMSFNKSSIDTIITRGYQAAMAQDSLLRDVASKTKDRWTPVRGRPAMGFSEDSLVISDIMIEGVLPKERALLKHRMDLSPGQKISRKDLDHTVAQIYGSQAYDYVTYELLGQDNPFDLVLNCKRGPIHQFGLGVRADNEELVAVLVNIGLNAHKFYGHTFDFTAKVSTDPYVKLHWSYDTPEIPTINIEAASRWTDMSMLNLGANRLSLNYTCSKQVFYVSNINWRHMDVRGGFRNRMIRIEDIKSTQFIGDYDFGQLNNDFLSFFAEGGTYTFDDGYFPTKGVDAGLSYEWTFAGFPRKFHNFHTVQADAKTVFPIGERLSLLPSFNFRFLFGKEVPVAFFNAIGGSLPARYIDQQIPFIGVSNLSAMKNILTVFRTDLRYKIANNHYVTGIINYARDCDYLKDYAVGPGYFGAGIEYSFDTIFGPLTANLNWSNINKAVGLYISAGYNF